ncbi:hypothetical protein BO70DRAFT_292565 [Aspergillus heteromorphus CBS 117.55]|uniref:Complex 1 LYR protein domain-containing protein n=1 Tax=Aspergillus heteromorphus CBS 117.55 TaxID=1448321 RepID=A0A317W211_9EURO|nr:uncharacterized protein BO70DRAFT_292565 [Aspergillus heteromorphus CBS 117.55]PWY80614.1 hypothetical protein BO70DRAFT_292565 [Aspergillus heteromorphus CBS 117.55]
MHKLVVPRKSLAHRFATLALYRGLLRQCAKLPDTPSDLSACRPYIQQRFHKYKGLQSPSQTIHSLKAGYEALDLLYSASQGNQHDVGRITKLIAESRRAKQQASEWQRERAKLQPVQPLNRKKQKKNANRDFQKSTALRHPDAEPILSRPRPVVKGKRHIPVLVNARGLPFLRIKKPQPKFLSAVLNSKAEMRWKWIERAQRLEHELVMAQDEDEWDVLTGHGEDETWAQSVQLSYRNVCLTIKRADQRSQELAESMWKVVLAERKLAEEEKQRSLDNDPTGKEKT